MRKRIFALFLILLLAASLLSTSLAESETPEKDTSSLDAEQFGEGAVVERDANGEPISVNFSPVRKVRAGINLRSNREAFEYSVWFTEYPFLQPATQYDGNLAVMSLAMALSANRALNPSAEATTYFDPSLHLEKFLEDAGFSNIRKDDYSKETSMYTISMAMGSRVMEPEGEEPFTLIAIGVCGGGYGNEWQSNMTPGSGEIHKGFLSASKLVIDRLAGYILTNGIQGNVKIWISGFSRAAAVSNVTAGLLVRDGMFPKENVYAYTFATPAAVLNPPESGFENIFNIINPMDLVPQVMPSDWNFGRFGIDRFIPVTEFSSVGETFTDSRARIARQTFGVEANYSPALNLRMRLLLSMILDVAQNRDRYNATLQPAVVGIMQKKNASNLLSTVRSLMLTVKDNGAEGRTRVDTLVDYVFRVFGNVLTRTEFDEANQNSGGFAFRLFNEHCEDAYLANVDLIRAGTFEDDYAFTYVMIRGPVNVVLSDLNVPGQAIAVTEKGELISGSVPVDDSPAQGQTAHRYYAERVGKTTVLAVPHDADLLVTWEAVRSGEVEVRFANCSVHASARYEGATSEPLHVSKGDAGTAYHSEKGVLRNSSGFTAETFAAADLAGFLGVGSVGVSWRVTLMIFAALAGIVVTVLIWAAMLLQRNRRKPGVLVWICLCVFCISMLEAELAFWFFADHTNLRMLWKMILGAALLLIFLYRHWHARRTLLMLPGIFMLIAADVVMCLYVLQGLILFLIAHALLVFAFLFRSPMPRKMWIQWAAVSAIASALIVFAFIREIGPLAWGAALYVVVLLLMSYSAGGQPVRVRFAARLFLISETILGVYMLMYSEPALHILSVLMFDTALLMLSVNRSGVEQPSEPEPPADAEEESEEEPPADAEEDAEPEPPADAEEESEPETPADTEEESEAEPQEG